jgi:hypothetical protein
MTGCWVSRKCLFACLPVEESQQPTWPHDWHSRRATQKVPSVRHSSQASGVFCGGKLSGVNPAKCSHELAIVSSQLSICSHLTSNPSLVHCEFEILPGCLYRFSKAAASHELIEMRRRFPGGKTTSSSCALLESPRLSVSTAVSTAEIRNNLAHLASSTHCQQQLPVDVGHTESHLRLISIKTMAQKTFVCVRRKI